MAHIDVLTVETPPLVSFLVTDFLTNVDSVCPGTYPERERKGQHPPGRC